MDPDQTEVGENIRHVARLLSSEMHGLQSYMESLNDCHEKLIRTHGDDTAFLREIATFKENLTGIENKIEIIELYTRFLATSTDIRDTIAIVIPEGKTPIEKEVTVINKLSSLIQALYDRVMWESHKLYNKYK